jgi:hypothetical protein
MVQFSPFLLQLINVAIEILEYEIELIVLLDQLQKLDDVGVMQFAEDTDLVQSDALVPVTVLVLHLFYGYQLPGEFVDPLEYASETAVAQFVP